MASVSSGLEMEERTHLIFQESGDSCSDMEDYKTHLRDLDSKRRNHYLQQPSTTISLILLLVVTATASALLMGSAVYTLDRFGRSPASGFSSSTSKPGTLFGDCGETVPDAIASGCIYDVMSSIWLPPTCADPELTQQFLALKAWTWWYDRNMTQKVPFAEVQAGEHEALWVSREFHWYHCTYMWRKFHRGVLKGIENLEDDANESRAMVKGGVTDSYIGKYHHTEHCEKMLIDETPGEVVDTEIKRKFGKCIWL